MEKHLARNKFRSSDSTFCQSVLLCQSVRRQILNDTYIAKYSNLIVFVSRQVSIYLKPPKKGIKSLTRDQNFEFTLI